MRPTLVDVLTLASGNRPRKRSSAASAVTAATTPAVASAACTAAIASPAAVAATATPVTSVAVVGEVSWPVVPVGGPAGGGCAGTTVAEGAAA